MDAEAYRKVIKEATAGEIEAKEFYLDVSKRIKNTYLQELFQGFSKEEEKHERILNDILDKGKITATTFGRPQEYKISETFPLPEVTMDMNLKEAIGLAMKNEEIAMKKYHEIFRIEVAYPEIW